MVHRRIRPQVHPDQIDQIQIQNESDIPSWICFLSVKGFQQRNEEMYETPPVRRESVGQTESR